MTLDLDLDVPLSPEQALRELRRSIAHPDIAREDLSVLGRLDQLYFGRFDSAHFSAWRTPSTVLARWNPTVDGYVYALGGRARVQLRVSAGFPPAVLLAEAGFIAVVLTGMALVRAMPLLLLPAIGVMLLAGAAGALLERHQRAEAARAARFFSQRLPGAVVMAR
ncbi:hypothetical protein FGE12_04750 [Aggregicoccus sp. 17bor-14]|uniref:hypothetical protein n=1 Tax=Myxococcaceae TaxID=31 RepID=UPI00129CBDCB|nr:MULTISPECIES: hypothetical protein [Myxococcaceae]MBF5041689.1 hypothetical protein [Simulacricoccus sp. 17bor-14]MRI87471.1 hypothetical protein [Aggregicoccus sp. 17bor-14]